MNSSSEENIQPSTSRVIPEPSSSLWSTNVNWNYLRNYVSSLFANNSNTSDKNVGTTKIGPVLKLITPKEKFEDKKSIKERKGRRISRDDLRVRTIGLIKKLKVSTSSGSQFMRTRELCNHFLGE
uniref:Uncharacterized protein n=1 Tax=Romanomermis culicivorax TaxID=13658 RepID=A0A915KQ34_ROMCU